MQLTTIYRAIGWGLVLMPASLLFVGGVAPAWDLVDPWETSAISLADDSSTANPVFPESVVLDERVTSDGAAPELEHISQSAVARTPAWCTEKPPQDWVVEVDKLADPWGQKAEIPELSLVVDPWKDQGLASRSSVTAGPQRDAHSGPHGWANAAELLVDPWR